VASQDHAKVYFLVVGMSGESRLGRVFRAINVSVARLSDTVLVAVVNF